MTAPQYAKCRCGHLKQRHEAAGIAPQCIADSCSCLQYRPDVPQVAPIASPLRAAPAPSPAAHPADWMAATVQAALASDVKAIRVRGARVAAQLNELRNLIQEDAGKAQARQRVQRLEGELAAVRAALRGPGSTGGSPPGHMRGYIDPPLACDADGCDFTTHYRNGMTSHVSFKHPSALEEA